MEPIFFEPIYKYNVWGGNRISESLKNIEKMQIGESWEIAANKNGNSIIKNGAFEGKTLKDVFDDKKNRVKLFGENCKKLQKFPLLIKFIDAKENLSVQVHPNNFYAKKLEKDTGKTELWYIMDCKENANIICGLKSDIKSKKDLDKLNQDTILEHLNYVPIKKGDSIFINAGTVHAIMADTLICEIQQNSDLTYRVYDWGRNDKSRILHLRKSKKVINLKSKLQIKEDLEKKNSIKPICRSKFFNIDKINVSDELTLKSSKLTFQAVNVIKGKGRMVCKDKTYEIAKGESFIIPSNLGNYLLKGNMEILMSYIGKKK